jgi:MFS family permease
LFALASAACSLAIDARVFIAARALQGVGGAMMIPGSLALIAAGVAPERLGRAIGVWTAGSVIATAAGPVIGGLLARGGLWRAVFWINVPIAAAALWILLTKTP